MATTMTMVTDAEDFLTARSVVADTQVKQLRAQARAIRIQQARMITRHQQGVGALEARLVNLYQRIDNLVLAGAR